MGFSDWWCTPPDVATPLEQLFGGPVGVDPCSNPMSIVRAHLRLFELGLALPWARVGHEGSETVYENPPYSQGGAWAQKAIDEVNSGRVRELIRLVMLQASTRWWRDQCLLAKRNPRILALKRLSFLDPATGNKRMSCHFEPALVYFGPRHACLEREFAHVTSWSTWGR